MGRTSKRHTAQKDLMTQGKSAAVQKNRRYKAGIYARISADIEDKKSESIEVQIEIAKKFVAEWNRKHQDKIHVVDCYIDLGKTGTNFNRDAFQKLMQDVRMGDIDCVIVKDLSRFGRNYLEAGNYIEKIFPFLGLRFIAVSDGLDTGIDGCENKQTSTAMAAEIRNLVNDMYARDFSKKAKVSHEQRRGEGSYTGGPAPYGYKAVWDGRIRKLMPDENTAGIVRYIFETFIQAESYAKVTAHLKRQRINPPSVYLKTGEVYCPSDEIYKSWDKSSVERMIKSDTYLGKLVQGKTSITARDEKNRIRRPEAEWAVKKDAHVPLITQETAFAAREVREKWKRRAKTFSHPALGRPMGEDIFDKVIYCGVCGRKMTRNSYVQRHGDGRKTRMGGYFCLDCGASKTDSGPVPNRISNIVLLEILNTLLKKQFAVGLKEQRIYLERAEEMIRQKKLESEHNIRFAACKKLRLREEESSKYAEYREGGLSPKEYAAYKMKKEEQLRRLEKQESSLREQEADLERSGKVYLKAVRASIKLKDEKVFTKEFIGALIERIYVYPGKRVEIAFSYNDVLTEWMGPNERKQEDRYLSPPIPGRGTPGW